jgi:hypothetical protein
MSTSYKPTFFVIDKISQDHWNKRTNVAQYKVQVWTTTNKGTMSYWKHEWFTLQEGFQVGDTLKLTK